MKTLGMSAIALLAWVFACTAGYAYDTPMYWVNVIVAGCLFIAPLALIWRMMG